MFSFEGAALEAEVQQLEHHHRVAGVVGSVVDDAFSARILRAARQAAAQLADATTEPIEEHPR